MMEYFYRIYGLRVQSQIPFSEAVPETAGEAEVKIVFGRMPDFLLEAGQKGYGTWTNGFVSGLVPHPGRNTGLCGRGQ